MLVAGDGHCARTDRPVERARSEVPGDHSRVDNLSAGATHMQKDEHQHGEAEKANAISVHLPSPLLWILLGRVHARADKCKLAWKNLRLGAIGRPLCRAWNAGGYPRRGSNAQPTVPKTVALSVELRGLVAIYSQRQTSAYYHSARLGGKLLKPVRRIWRWPTGRRLARLARNNTTCASPVYFWPAYGWLTGQRKLNI